MESLVLLVMYIALAITLIVFIVLLVLTIILRKKYFPGMHKAWFFLLVPLLLVLSFLISLVILRILGSMNS